MPIDKKNIFLKNTNVSIPYSSHPVPNSKKYPIRNDKKSHALYIERKLKNCYERSNEQKKAAAIRYKEGVYLEFSSASNCDLAIERLENRSQGIRLLNVKKDEDVVKATVYIPQGKEQKFIKKVEEYASAVTKNGNPKNNDLVSSIEDIRLAMLDSFWFGNSSDMPSKEPVWCEIWAIYEEKTFQFARENIMSCFKDLKIEVKPDELKFPERLVFLVKANESQLISLISTCEYIAEIRRAPESTGFFSELPGYEQKEWIDELLQRTEFTSSGTYICILDTGLNSSNPLILPAVCSDADLHAVKKEWGVNDHNGHGTEMAGVAVYKDLKESLLQKEKLTINHSLESVKILPPRGENAAELYGSITEQAVALVEYTNPNVDRIICMAVTSSQFNTEDGSPTSWSAAIDSITSGANENGQKRLFFVSAGNVYPEEVKKINYPDANIIHGVENPGQAWNAITVGAVSKEIIIDDEAYKGFKPVADLDELSPYSSTSTTWNSKWPIKPEILMDGGNMATNGIDYTECEDLSILTTNRLPLNKPLSTIWGTSSATAQVAWMSARLYEEYPKMWPETVRGLLVHSARWTDKMYSQFCEEDSKTKGRKQLLHTCGYGIPNLDKAIQCANNSVNLIVEDELQPFEKSKMNEMHIHTLPWPKEVLQSLGEKDVTIRVTLSYFIEPGPGEVGWKDKYRYPSCGLRFDVINSNETLEDFKKRINYKMRGDDKKDKGDGSSRDWYLGTNNRDVGSIHSDFCVDMAVNLADANYIAVYPVIGWWRERAYLGKYNEKVRYSLIVTIETEEVNTDLYTPIITAIKPPIETEIPT